MSLIDKAGPQDAAADRRGRLLLPASPAWRGSSARIRIPARCCGCWSPIIAFFCVSQGAVIWVYIGEVFPTSVRSKGQGVGSASHWFMNALIAQSFPWWCTMSTATPFVFFAVVTVVQFVVVRWSTRRPRARRWSSCSAS